MRYNFQIMVSGTIKVNEHEGAEVAANTSANVANQLAQSMTNGGNFTLDTITSGVRLIPEGASLNLQPGPMQPSPRF